MEENQLRTSEAWQCLIVTLFLLVFAVALPIKLMGLQPHLPTYSIVDLRLEHLDLERKAVLEDFELNAKVALTLLAHNRDRHRELCHDHTVITLWYGSAELGRTWIPPYHQVNRNVTLSSARILVERVPLSSDSAARLMSAKDEHHIPLRVDISVHGRSKGRESESSLRIRTSISCELIVSYIHSGILYKRCRKIVERLARAKVLMALAEQLTGRGKDWQGAVNVGPQTLQSRAEKKAAET